MRGGSGSLTEARAGAGHRTAGQEVGRRVASSREAGAEPALSEARVRPVVQPGPRSKAGAFLQEPAVAPVCGGASGNPGMPPCRAGVGLRAEEGVRVYIDSY